MAPLWFCLLFRNTDGIACSAIVRRATLQGVRLDLWGSQISTEASFRVPVRKSVLYPRDVTRRKYC